MSNAPIERHEDQACEVPFVEQLRSVPDKCRLTLEIQWAEDGTATGHQFIPVGFMMHRAADEIESLRKDAERYRWLRIQHDEGDEQAFVYGAHGKLDDYVDAEMVVPVIERGEN